jgi:lipoprotein-anchoring transpeptidase ErfK/SrfK
MMLLCLGTASVLLMIQWRVWSAPSKTTADWAAIGLSPLSPATPKLKLSLQPAVFQVAQLFQDPVVRAEQARIGAITNSGQTSVSVPVTDTSVVVTLSDRRVYLYKSGRSIASYPLAIGQRGWETPTGTFHVLRMLQAPVWQHPITGEIVPPGANNPLGSRWIGFWADDRTEIGFHGTNQEELIGQAVSHGCLRMRNRDVEALYTQIAEGTPVTVRP